MDGRGARRKVAFAATASVVVLALLGFAAFEFTGRVNHTVAGHTTGNYITASPAASETAKATASARTAATPASPRPSKTGNKSRDKTREKTRHKTRRKTRRKPILARTPSAAPSAVPSVLAPVSAAAFGPDGTADGDNPGNASLVLTDPALGWTTDWYATPEFGALKTGTGLLLDMGHPVTITAAGATLDGQSGADLELRVGPAPGDLTALASASDVGGSVNFPLSQPAYARYVLLWFTRLPPDDAGTYQVTVHGITVYGEP